MCGMAMWGCIDATLHTTCVASSKLPTAVIRGDPSPTRVRHAQGAAPSHNAENCRETHPPHCDPPTTIFSAPGNCAIVSAAGNYVIVSKCQGTAATSQIRLGPVASIMRLSGPQHCPAKHKQMVAALRSR